MAPTTDPPAVPEGKRFAERYRYLIAFALVVAVGSVGVSLTRDDDGAEPPAAPTATFCERLLEVGAICLMPHQRPTSPAHDLDAQAGAGLAPP